MSQFCIGSILGFKPFIRSKNESRGQSYNRELQRQRCKIYNATNSLVLVRFENKYIYSSLKTLLSTTYNAGVVFM
jgi:hypothetical protein